MGETKEEVQKNKRLSDGKKITTPRDEQFYFRRVKGNRKHTLKHLKSRFNITGRSVSERTIRKRFCDYGYRKHVVLNRITISHVNQVRTKSFCTQKLT